MYRDADFTSTLMVIKQKLAGVGPHVHQSLGEGKLVLLTLVLSVIQVLDA